MDYSRVAYGFFTLLFACGAVYFIRLWLISHHGSFSRRVGFWLGAACVAAVILRMIWAGILKL